MLVGIPPYFSLDKDELVNNILTGSLKLPKSMSVEAKDLIASLLNRNPVRRLGSGTEGTREIVKHPFFKGINWNSVI